MAARDYGPLPADRGGQPRILLIRRFDWDDLAPLRSAVGAAAARHGVPEVHRGPLVLAVHEAAANAVRHGGGSGQLLLWLQAGNLYAEISDHGPGIPEGPRLLAATPGNGIHERRGLWMINQISADLNIDTGATGTRLLLRYPIDSPGG
ncbi:ATP-binding protein [Actinoplanes sp. NPDC023801]|uniref:ATP-binding protein n=1 Tax=Actinoplanes sp. NPDC023801 TaxID=3154595 RepID=UPI0033E06822